ncbi:hypothetical protein [Clostridium beijerinckii]|nr:hypothetical protein [Clostridium beijerinckii]
MKIALLKNRVSQCFLVDFRADIIAVGEGSELIKRIANKEDL